MNGENELLGNRVCVFQRIVQGLVRTHGAFDQAPAVVVVTHRRSGFVLQSGCVQGGPDFIHGRPSPREFNFRGVITFADAGNCDQFASRGGDAEILLPRFCPMNQVAKGIDTEWSHRDFPAWRRCDLRWALRDRTDDPAVMLQDEVLRRRKVLVRNRADPQPELLRSSEGIGAGDERGGETARKKVARSARDQRTQHRHDESEFSHE